MAEAYQVRGNLKAFIDTLAGLSVKERQQHPKAEYGQNFNDLLKLAKEVAPGVDGQLWPQPVRIIENPPAFPTTGASYAEVETYARQVLGLIPEEPLLPSRG